VDNCKGRPSNGKNLAKLTVYSARWGHYLQEFMSIQVLNLALPGRSTRSFMSEGAWAKLLAQTSPGDFVVVEMGHNDESDPTKEERYSERGTLPGTGFESKTITVNGKEERVHTFGHYLRLMIEGVQDKQATPILSGMVPRNYWNGTKMRTDWPFATYARQIAGIAKIEYLDHTLYSLKRFDKMGPERAKAYYPVDNTHTNAEGARSRYLQVAY
jgi:rhamnogalacturonan acetylesterase